MTKRDGLLALLVAGAMLGPWQTANRLSRVIVVIGACPDLWPARGALVGGIMALHYEGSTAVRALRGKPHGALRREHHRAILATTNDWESDAIDPPAW